MAITLREVTKDNWRDVVKLKLTDEQKNFVAPNWYSILQSIYEFGFARAIYLDDTPMGFAWYGTNPPQETRWWICRFMIGLNYQGKGYGRTALNQIIADIRTNPGVGDIYISFMPDNKVARKLYESVGFVDTGEMDEDELVFVLKEPTK